MRTLTISQKIGLKFLTTIDSNMALFLLLRPLHVTMRALFYTVLIVGTFIISKLGLSLLELINNVNSWIASIPTIGVSFILCYEAIYGLDIQEILKEKKFEKQFIKTHKLQKWRLRNMRWFVRSLFYVTLYIILQQFIQITSMIAFYTTIEVPAQTQIAQFINEFETLMEYFTVGYILILVTLEYFINKRKAEQCLNHS